MECNKEESIRAKCIEENKMPNKDFIAAKKIVLKPEQLYSDLENVSQMLTVCEVLCSAESKVNGEMDWYGILQVHSTADELTIKKQYQKLVLLLHPDKNKFGGAEAAFNLVGDAHMTLTDKSKRAIHDMKRSGFMTVSGRQPVPQTNRTSAIRMQPGVASSFVNSTSTQSNGFNQQPGSFSTNQTFWTICASCGVRYQYYQSIMNRALHCQRCKKPFIAYDINAHSVPSAAPWNRNGIPRQEKQAPTGHFTGLKCNFGTGSDVGSHGTVGGGSAEAQPSSRSGFNTEFVGASNINSKENVNVHMDSGTANDVKFERLKLQEVNKYDQAVKPSTASRSQKRRRKKTVESSESESDMYVVVGYNDHSGHTTGTSGSCPRRSSRQKRNISYNEDHSDDDYFESFWTGSMSGNTEQNDPNCMNGQTSEAAAATGGKGSICEGCVSSESLPNGLHKREQVRNDKERGLNAGASSKASASVDFNSEALPDDPEGYMYPDPEFYNFEGGRDESNFAVDQIWAIFCNSDAMPRYYALITHVYGPKFKLQFNWLEYEPTSKAETLWYNVGLPVGCGTFNLGKAELTHKRLIFSHLMPMKKGTKKNTYDILPRKGEVWAVFKNWDIEWSSCVEPNRHYEYEVVEVISDFTEGSVISVVRLVKVQGFLSLFVQSIDSLSSRLNIQCKDILRFSHSIPSYRLKGNEREGIPKGLLELDCASLPLNFADMFPSVSVESIMGRAEDLNNVWNGLHSKSGSIKDEVPTCTANKSSPEVNKYDQAVKPSTASRSQKRGRKKTVESSESESDSYVVVRHKYHSGQTTGTSGSCPRRSSRQKRNISYNEDHSDDDYFESFRTGSMSGNTEQNDPNCINGQTSEAAAAAAGGGKGSICEGCVSSESLPNGLHKREQVRNYKEHGLNAGASSKASASVDFSSEALPDDPEGYMYPDPEFYNFEGGRDESKFAVDQIWAIFCNSDAMPRYYALITHVYGPKFKLRFRWLEYEPTSKAETLWYYVGLPVGCGAFNQGKSELTHERLIFSHLMPWKKGTKKNTYDILPIKGDVWAVFKNWDIEWSSCFDPNRHYEYEIVEVMSDFTEGRVISVVRLVKVQGFVSLFVQAIDSRSSRLNIQREDKLRFSHSIPSYRLKGNEREGIPKGSLELDCASLPLNFADTFPSVSVESILGRAEDLNGIAGGSKCHAESETTRKCYGCHVIDTSSPTWLSFGT